MHVRHRDITHDVMAPPDNVTSENKRRTLDVVHQKRVTTELPKTAAIPKAGISQIARWST